MKTKQVRSRYLEYTNAFKDSNSKFDSHYDKTTTRPLTIDEKDVQEEEDIQNRVRKGHHDRSSPQFMSYQGPPKNPSPSKLNTRNSEFVEFLEGLDTKYQTNSAALIKNSEIALNVKERKSKLRNHYIDIYNTGDAVPNKKKAINPNVSSLKNFGKASLSTIAYCHN